MERQKQAATPIYSMKLLTDTLLHSIPEKTNVKSYMKLLAFAVMLLGALLSRHCNAAPDQPAATTFPVTLLRSTGIPAAEITIGSGTGKFAFETGANVSLISSEKADALGLKRGRAMSSDGRPVVFNGKPAEAVTVSRMRVGTLELENIPFAIVDGPRLTSFMKDPVDGVIGANFFVTHPVLFDFDKSEITLWRSGALNAAALNKVGFSDAVRLPVSDPRRNLSFVIPARINDMENVELSVSTGSVITVIAAQAARKLALKPDQTIKDYASFQGPLTVNDTKVAKITIGSLATNGPHVFYADNDTASFPPCIGLDVLSNYRILLDAPGKTLYVKPRSPHAGLGLSLEMDSRNRLIVDGVDDNTPAKEAGLEIGDEVLEVNSKLIKDLTGETLVKEVKKAEGETVTFKIRPRNQTQPRIVKLKVRKLG
jgi:predicted aspartyl protease